MPNDNEIEYAIVYRVEGPDGWGPYSSAFRSHAVEDALSDGWSMETERWPPPATDFDRPVLDIVGRWHGRRFGFATPEQLRDWMEPALPHLADAGFVVTEYRVSADRVFHGGKQVVFDGTAAEEVRRVSIPKFGTLAEASADPDQLPLALDDAA